jgi:hypothetical protein
MLIELSCDCGARYRVGDHLAGKKLRCKKCKGHIVVPEAESEQPFGDDDFGEYDVAQTPAPLSAAARNSYTAAPASDHVGQPSPLPRESYSLNGTVASNPGRLKVQWLKCVTSFPVMPIVFVVLLIISLILGLAYRPAIFIVAAGLVLTAAREFKMMQVKFISGCVNPGVVVSTSPYLVAVYTDLAKQGGFRPAVKIIRQPLGRMTGGAPALGARVATAALYYGGGSDAWRDFVPVVVNCVTSNQADINRMTRSISANDWRDLDQALASLNDNRKGLHTLWDGDRAGNARRSRQQFQPVLGVVVVALIVIVIVMNWKGKGTNVQSNPAPNFSQPPPIYVAPPAVQAKPKYAVGDNVEVLWGEKWFPATVVKVDGEKTRVHYEKYGDGGDHWVGPERVRKPAGNNSSAPGK